MSECCLQGFRWESKPRGTESILAGRDCYVTGTNKGVAILVIHDLWGWTFPNTRILADHFAQEVDATVYVPDFFGGEVLPADLLGNPAEWGPLNIPAFLQRNTKAIRYPEILECAKLLSGQYDRLGAIGYCFGGWGVFRLGAKPNSLVTCVSTAHPSGLEKAEIQAIGVPVQIMAPEHDNQFTEELKAFANQIIPTLGVAYDYQFFSGLHHAFAIRGDPKNEAERKGMERAKNAAVLWFIQWLHRN